ncbi:MAG: pilin [Patescibacteria group bacterium]
MRKFLHIRELLGVTCLMIVALAIFSTVEIGLAKEFIPIKGEGFGVFPSPNEGQDGVTIAKGLVAKLADNARFLLGAVATLFLIIAAIKLVISQGNEEEYKKQQTTIIMCIVGLALVGLAGDISEVLTAEDGGFLVNPQEAIQRSKIFDRSVQIVLTFIRYIVGSVCVLFIVRSGTRLVVVGDEEETLTKEKKTIGYGLIGLVFILLSTPLVNNVFFKIDKSKYPGIDAVRPQLDAAAGLGELVGVTNFIVSFVAPFAILSLVAGGVLYMVARGDDQKIESAKKIMLWSLLGIVIIYGAFGIVSTIIAGRFEGI